MNVEAIDDESPLIQSFSSGDILGGPSKRTHLSLSWAVAQLGWIAGPSFLMLFASITVVSSYLLSDCYRFPDPQHGNIRNPSYMLAVKIYLG
ncbi:putative amino acid permease 7 [Stylosanthes scabra]|uniref:Amino acid permease 7 n=1 Tax=Stylosanthes scabra TaxID=79078 RepID=A0ABU6QL97_9FABA|nr:putative amino acid permease 7 [Stylosanthes scabra]